MSSDLTAVTPASDPHYTACIPVSKDIASGATVGQSVRLELVGEVKEIRQQYGNSESYELVLSDPTVKSATPDESEDKKDENLATMPKDNLKKIISKKD